MQKMSTMKYLEFTEEQQQQKEQNHQPRILYSVELSLKSKEIKTFRQAKIEGICYH